MGITQHRYIGNENDWYNTDDIGELTEQIARDRTNAMDIRDRNLRDDFNPYDDEDEFSIYD